MPTTASGIYYPASTDAPRVWEDMQDLADSVETAISTDRTSRDAAWTSFTPTMSATTSGGSLGNATSTARYKRIGRTIIAQADITVGSTTSFGTGTTLWALPVTARSNIPGLVGTCMLLDASPVTRYSGCVALNNTSTILLMKYDGTLTGAANPWTWATGDTVRWEVTYEAATA